VPAFRRPSLPSGPLRDLVGALHDLHLAAGHPSTRQLQHDIGGPGVISHTSVHNVFTEPRLPTWGLVELIVEAMARRAGIDAEAEVNRFRTLWGQAARPAATSTPLGDAPLAHDPKNGPDASGEALQPLSRPFLELLPAALDEIEAIGTHNVADRADRIPTGFEDLDTLLGQWSLGSLIVIGGRPSSGKTMLLLKFCQAASIMHGIPSLFISGEMNSVDINTRILSAEARIPAHAVHTGQMQDDDWTRLARRMAAVSDAPIHISTPSKYRFEDISAEATRLSQESGLKLLLIDSLQWLTARSDSASKSAESSLWELKDLSTSLKITIIVSAQAERYIGEYLGSGHIQYLRDAIAIDIADVVIVLYRPDEEDRESPRAGEADLIVVKNRNGPTATVTVATQFHYCRFVDMKW